jgi:hypothetical protein
MNDYWCKRSEKEKAFGREDSRRVGRSERKGNRENVRI